MLSAVELALVTQLFDCWDGSSPAPPCSFPSSPEPNNIETIDRILSSVGLAGVGLGLLLLGIWIWRQRRSQKPPPILP